MVASINMWGGIDMNFKNSIVDAYPLTMLQAGMLYHSQLEENTSIYHDITSYHVEANFNEAIFRRALEKLAKSHEIIRTSIDLVNFSQAVQLVHKNATIPLSIEYINHFEEKEQDIIIQDWIKEEKYKSLDWGRPPLMRIMIHIRSMSSFQISISFHHAILDGWSVALMVTELKQTYLNMLQGIDVPIKPLKTKYRDYVALENEALNSETHKSFWKEKLDNYVLNKLPKEHVMSNDMAENTRGRGIKKFISSDILLKLKGLSKEIGIPLKSILLTAHVKVMSLISGDDDIVTGVLFNGRPESADSERVLGLFLNNIPFRIKLEDKSWIDLIKEIFKCEQEIIKYRNFPLAEIQKMNGGGRLFDTVFNYTNFHVYNKNNEGNEIIRDTIFFEHTNFPLLVSFSLDYSKSKLRLILSHDRKRLRDNQVKKISEYYIKALEDIVDNPLELHNSRNFISSEEKFKLLLGFNDTFTSIDLSKCVHELIEQQVDKTPEKTAVIVGDKSITYAELDRMSNKVAHYLLKKSVKAGMIVGICIEPTIELVITIYAILKTGAAYLPIDTAFPDERINFIVNDSQLNILITYKNSKSINIDSESKIIPLHEEWEKILNEDDKRAKTELTSEELAYVIYTSGSTGKPKGVQVPHRSVVNFLESMKKQPGLDEKDRLLCVTTIAFDISALEIFLPITVGACVVLANREQASDGFKLTELVDKHNINVMQATPTTWKLLIEAGWKGNKNFKALCGGEVLNKQLAQNILNRCGELWNMYGPTETTIWSTVSRIKPEDNIITIGRPIDNTEIYILNSRFELVPIGTVGELFIGGAGVSKGYLNRPELTNEKFISNIFSKNKDDLMFRTGDLARYMFDGNIEILGRIDNQVKIRGFRIELGEIEKAISKHPLINESVATVKEISIDDKRLIAYYTSEAAITPSSNEIRTFLKKKLPNYMIPSAYMKLDTMPLTPNGKLDRAGLPKIHGTRDRRAYVVPRNLVEYKLVGIWQELFNIKPIGVKDNFIELGGHSLTALRLMARVKQEFKKNIPMSVLFKDGTIEQLAQIVLNHKSTEASSLVPIQTEGTKRPIFFVHPFGGHVFCYAELSLALGSDQPFYALQAVGLDGESDPLTNIEEMASYYIEQIKMVQPHGPYVVGGWCMGGTISYEMARQLKHMGERVQILVIVSASNVEEIPDDIQKDDLELLKFAIAQGHSIYTDDLISLKPEEQLEIVFNRAKENGILRFDVTDMSQARLLWNVYKAHRQAMFKYHTSEYDGKALLIRTAKNHLKDTLNKDLGWGKVILGELSIEEVPGDHYTALTEPNVIFTAKTLNRYIDVK